MRKKEISEMMDKITDPATRLFVEEEVEKLEKQAAFATLEARKQLKKDFKIRKHNWLPCLLSSQIDLDSMPDKERRKMLRATKWLDRLTDREYRYFFNRETLSKGSQAVTKSNLKKKIREWLMAISTVWFFEPSLYIDAVFEAKKLYEEQTGRPFITNSKK